MPYSKSNAKRMAIVLAVTMTAAILLGLLVRYEPSTPDIEKQEIKIKEKAPASAFAGE